MSHALQVNFRRLPPSETLVALAAERYALLRRTLQGPGECLVSLEAQEHARRPLTHAVVSVQSEGLPRAEARVSHRHPHTALSLALTDVQLQLGCFDVTNVLRTLRSA